MGRFSDEKLQRILQRAIEIDARERADMSEADLRAIAREIGVSKSSVDKAVRQVEGEAVAEAGVTDSPFWRGPTRILKWSAVTAGALSFVVQLMHELHLPVAWMFFSLYAGLISVSAVGALRNRRLGHAHFQSRNLALWVGFLAGGMLVSSTVLSHQGLTEFMEAFSIKGWLISSVIGFAIVMLRSAAGAARGSASPCASHETGIRSVWRSVVDRFTRHFREVHTPGPA
jgi:hypothetical protein